VFSSTKAIDQSFFEIRQIVDKKSLLGEHIFVIFSPALDYTSTCNKTKQKLTKKAHDSH